MDNPAAVHRLTVGVPATVEHGSGEAGVETGKWVAEVTQVRLCRRRRLPWPPSLLTTNPSLPVVHHPPRRSQAQHARKRSAAPVPVGLNERVLSVQSVGRMGGKGQDLALVCFACVRM